MPLVRFEVRNEVGLGDPELYGGGGAGKGGGGDAEPKALLEGVAVAGLVGILRQLGDLAEFAADVFHDLHEQVITTSARGRKVLTRVQNIEAALPSLEKAVKNQKSHIHFAYVPGSDWHAQLQHEQNQLLSSDLPRFMMDSYEECRDPPRLYLLDKFDNAGAGACQKRYSDPSYFKKSWDVMEADKTGILQKEKRSHKIKRKGSRLKEPYHGQATSRKRNGELQRALTAVQLTSRTLGSPSNDGRSFSEHRSTSDARSNLDNISRSSSFSSKPRLSFAEQASDTKPSVVPHENGHDNLSDINHHYFNDASSPILLNRIVSDDLGDDSKQGSLPDEIVARSPSVEWDEKAAIVMTTSSVYCDDVVMDRAGNAETKHINIGLREIDHREMETMEHQGALLEKTKLVLVPSSLSRHDEVPSETDNYMDALNTLDSETETEVAFQTKIQRKPIPSFNVREPQVDSVDNVLSQPDSSVAEFPVTCQNSGTSHSIQGTVDSSTSSSADTPKISNHASSGYTDIRPNKWSSVENNTDDAIGDPLEVLEPASRPFSGTPPNPGSLGANEIPESKEENSPRVSPEIPEPGLSTHSVFPLNKEPAVNQIPDSNAEDVCGDSIVEDTSCLVLQPTISFVPTSGVEISPHDTTGGSFLISENHVKFGSCGVTEVSNSQTMPLNGSSDNGCATQHLPSSAPTSSIGVSSVKLWTNAGLFGLAPSKPPVFSGHDGPKENTLSGYEEHQPCHSTNHTELDCLKSTESAMADVPNGNTPINGSFLGKLAGINPGSASQNYSAARTPDEHYGQTDQLSNHSISFEHSGHRNMTGKQTTISELLFSEDNAENGAEYSGTDMAGRNNMHVVSASSFSSIAQRFLANTLQRRSFPKYNDLPMSSGRVNTDSNGNDEATANSTLASNETVFDASQFEKKTENGIYGLSKPSIFSSCHYSAQSSPPIEHMKISFHPMSAFEISKLNLDFSDENLHENAEDMMLPTFQLLPGSSVPQPGSGSESEDDTFGRSYSYSSYDDLSPRLYSNSELWDQEDGIRLDDHELYNDLNQIGSSTSHISSYMGFEQMNLSCEKATISPADIEDHNGLGKLESHSAGELPNFDTLMSTNNHQHGEALKDTISLADIEDHNRLGKLESHSAGELRNFDTLVSTNNHQNGEALKDTISLADIEDHNRLGKLESHPAGELPNFDTLMCTDNHQNGEALEVTISLADIEDHNGLGKLESHPCGELSNFDSLMSTNNHQYGEALIPHNTVNLSPDEDQLPPPPPLPPMQWRMMKQAAPLEEERSTTAKDMLKNTSILPPVHTPVQEEDLPSIAPPGLKGHVKEENHQKVDTMKEMSTLPNIFEIKASLLQQIRNKPDLQKLNGHEKSEPVLSDLNSLDERGDLLQQIRSKTFNLRRTNTSKTNTSSQSTANSNVVAILEKANAIRQAVASDEGGDDGNWSDI